MEEIKVTQITDPVFGKCLSMANELVELRVTLNFGPRIIYFACAGMENVFYQDEEKAALENFEEFDDVFKLYGGHRLWISPEVLPRCYHPDNLPVSYTEIGRSIRFTGEEEKYNKIQKSITIAMKPGSPHVSVIHSIRNKGLWDIQLAPWAITMLAPGGIEVMPMPSRETKYLANRNFSFWDYSELNDSRLYLGEEFLTLIQDANKKNPFKLGYNNEKGWAAYFNKGQVFLKYFEPEIDGIYPDNGCCFETYTNAKFLEMETLGEINELGPDDFITLEETWELYPADSPGNTRDEAKLRESVSEWVL